MRAMGAGDLDVHVIGDAVWVADTQVLGESDGITGADILPVNHLWSDIEHTRRATFVRISHFDAPESKVAAIAVTDMAHASSDGARTISPGSDM